MSSAPAAAPKAHFESFNPSTAHTRLNSLNHGATSKQLFISSEDPEAFMATLQENFRYYKPVTLETAVAGWYEQRSV